MQMTMTGVVLSIVLSGMVSLFISHRYLRERMGLGLAVMFFVPVTSCAAYIYFTAPYFNPAHTQVDTNNSTMESVTKEAVKEAVKKAVKEAIVTAIEKAEKAEITKTENTADKNTANNTK